MAVDVFAVAHLGHIDHLYFFFDTIDDAVLSYPDTPEFLLCTGKLFTARWVGIISQGLSALHHAGDVRFV